MSTKPETVISAIDEWEPVEGQKSLDGGQGQIIKVRHRLDGRFGARKSLQPSHLLSRERRFRMQQEVHLLKLLDGQGVPGVLWSNVEAWENAGTPLHAVIEWVEGPTLALVASGAPQALDSSLTTVTGLLEIVRRCHAAGVMHRDIKPDNIILRNGNIDQPILIDFGMGWADLDGDAVGDFSTAAGQELGNRFLRLPEYAPGNHVSDTRSDVTMIVGILYFLLTGVAPRVLLDPRGRMPHEESTNRFSEETKTDPRWERLRRVFTIGFQQRLELRFANAEQLASALNNLSPSPTQIDVVNNHLLRIQELLGSADGALLEQCQRVSLEALRAFYQEFTRRITQAFFEAGGQGPVIAEWGRAAKTTLFINRRGVDTPRVGFVNQISFENGVYQAAFSLVGDALWNSYYEGPLADSASLVEAASASVGRIFASLLERYGSELEKQITRMQPPPRSD